MGELRGAQGSSSLWERVPEASRPQYGSREPPQHVAPSSRARTTQISHVYYLTSPQTISSDISLSPRRPLSYHYTKPKQSTLHLLTITTYTTNNTPTRAHTHTHTHHTHTDLRPKPPPVLVAMSILFLACLLAICLPILSVQLPGLFPYLHLPHFLLPRSDVLAENRSTIHQRSPSVRRRLRPRRPAPTPRSQEQQGGRQATDGADSGARSEEGQEDERGETGSEEIHRQPKAVLKVEGSGKGKERADGREAGRKHWDPPVRRMGMGRRRFGMGMRLGMGNEGFDVPSTPPKKTGREMEA